MHLTAVSESFRACKGVQLVRQLQCLTKAVLVLYGQEWGGVVGVKHLPIKNTLNASLIFAVNMFACHEARPTNRELGKRWEGLNVTC